MSVDPKRIDRLFKACEELRPNCLYVAPHGCFYLKQNEGEDTEDEDEREKRTWLYPVYAHALICDRIVWWLAKRSIHIGYAAMQRPAWFAFTHCLGKMESVTTGGDTPVRIESDDRTECVMWAVEHELKLPEWKS